MFDSLLQAVAKIIITPIIFMIGAAGYQAPLPVSEFGVPVAQEAMVGAFNPSGGGTYRLGTSIGTTDTSIRLSSFKEPVSNISYTMSYLNTDVAYGTLAPQTNSREFISFTGITQNVDGSATLTGVTRGLSSSYPYTASSTLRQAHPGQSIFILSDAPGLFNEYAVKRNTETITGQWSFNTVLPSSTLSATTSNQFVNKSLLDATAFQGAATSTETNGGIVELATQIEMASSTNYGTAKPTVIQSKYATSTCTIAGLYVVVTENDGDINSNCIGQDQTYAWTGNHSFSASTTLSATTSIAASSTTTAPLNLRGQAYAFPATQTASSTVLMTDGAGTLSWNYPTVRALSSRTNLLLSNTSAATTTLFTVAIPANTIDGIAKTLRIGSMWDTTGSLAGYCGYQIDFGNGSATTTVGFVRTDNSYLGNLGQIDVKMVATSSSSAGFTSFGFMPQTATAGWQFSPVPTSVTGAAVGFGYTAASFAAQTYVSFRSYSSGGMGCRLLGETVEVISTP